MFFHTKTVKGTPLVQLVESNRNTEGQPRQRVVASLGDEDGRVITSITSPRNSS